MIDRPGKSQPGVTDMRRDRVLDLRARELVRRWLATLGPEGFTGSVADLFRALDSRRRHGDWIGPNCTRTVEEALPGTGFKLSRFRTKAARLVRVA